MSGVKVEMARLKRRVRKAQAAPDPLAILEYQAAVADRLTRKIVLGEDVSGYQMPPCPWPAGHFSGARERLAERIISISERRTRAAERERERGLARHGERAAFDESIQERMKKIDAETKGEAVAQPHTKLINETGNPLIEILRRRAGAGQFTVEEGEEDEHGD